MYEYSCELDRVVDGDTVDVVIDLGFDIKMNQRVRLLGVDTPEIRTRDTEEKAAGYRAKDYVEEMFEKSTSIMIQTRYDKRGKFGRVLGTFIITFEDGGVINLNQELLDRELAVPYR